MNKTIRNVSKFLIITLISVHASITSSEATEKPKLTNEQEEINARRSYLSGLNAFFKSDEFQDLIDGPSSVVALRHIRASLTAMGYNIYDYFKTGNFSYFSLWGNHNVPDAGISPVAK